MFLQLCRSGDPLSSNRCFRLSGLSALVRTHFAETCSAVYALSRPAALHVYNTLISTLQMDTGPLTNTPCLMINEQHLEPHVLLPRSTDMSFRTRHFVSSVKNELLGFVHYAVFSARALPCIVVFTKHHATLVLRVGVRVTSHLCHLSRLLSSEMHTEDPHDCNLGSVQKETSG